MGTREETTARLTCFAVTASRRYGFHEYTSSLYLDCSSTHRLELSIFDSNNKELSSSTGGGDSSIPAPSFPWEDELAHKLAAKLLFLEKRREIENENMVSIRSGSSIGHQYWGDDYVNQTYRSTNPRFKTEICRNFKEKGTCLYGDLCQFAHGSNELRPDVVRHSKYKTKL